MSGEVKNCNGRHVEEKKCQLKIFIGKTKHWVRENDFTEDDFL